MKLPEQPGGDPPQRRGCPPEPICESAGLAHRTWLEPVRSRLVASGLTLDDLVSRSGYSKAHLSELLRGKGYYPGWEITYSVVRALEIPVGPLLRLWKAAAVEADKNTAWIRSRIRDVRTDVVEEPPVAHLGLTQAMWRPYTASAQVFLQSEPRARQAVGETFDILWLTWDQATASPDTPRHAWQLLRSTVLSRTPKRPAGHPDLRAAAFCTTAQAEAGDLGERLARIDIHARFFDAIARLPADQMDITVLRYLCGIAPGAIPGIVGLSPAITHTLDHHARGALNELFPDTDTQE
ncbi:RNA polymerase, sigma-24 subunit, ECF subfamily [Streptomyces davaonensis JCM 4913]|uniref:RNA polymerase, sigma-24 subunit, ECF subfamily n=1 Tax=Streptomyces davaonensis (strain DSM 101723 / JCM 4913 / KCC S-0913 / 768) TaxID=1214101 RepID=K4R9A8_STRDJ|nr:RNA polymerase sigma-24 subunit ECF subfamily [Streptomyces davaonensis]CCK32836.1 RNA polymerase, sigma-24 subunit, ECF subfamily [Streptomyces davaonensis JCM 4913]